MQTGRSRPVPRVTTLEVSRRNDTFVVSRFDGHPLFVKVAVGSSAARGLVHEGWTYRLFTSVEDPALLAATPHLVLFDPEKPVVVTTFVAGAVDLWTQHLALDRLTAGPAVALGRALAAVHRATPVSVLRVRHPDFVDRAGVRIPDTGLPDLLADDSATAAALDTHARPRLATLADGCREVAEEWTPTCLIHRDLTFDNCLVRDGEDAPSRAVIIVDWEFATIGDPCWDTATVVAEYLLVGLARTLRWPRAPSAAALVDAFVTSLERDPPPLSAFVDSYLGGRSMDAEAPAEHIARMIRYLPWRLLHTALADVSRTEAMSASTLLLLQMADNIARDPRWAQELLLGSRSRDSRPENRES